MWVALAWAGEAVLDAAGDDAAVRWGPSVGTGWIGEDRRYVGVGAGEPAGLLPPAGAARGLALLLRRRRWARASLDGGGGAPSSALDVRRGRPTEASRRMVS